MLEFVFNKVAGLKALNFIKKRLQHRRSPVKFAKFLKTYFEEHHRTTAFILCMSTTNVIDMRFV